MVPRFHCSSFFLPSLAPCLTPFPSQGAIEKVDNDTYKCTGTITRVDDSTIEVTELPIRTWTQTYKETLEAWVTTTEKTPALVKVRVPLFSLVFATC